MEEFVDGNIRLVCCDCMEYMRGMVESGMPVYDLAVVDPPYAWHGNYGRRGGRWGSTFGDEWQRWDNPVSDEYFELLRRISRNQVIWGGNYYNLPAARCFLVWDKKDKIPTLADCEYAWTSFDSNARVFSSARNPGGITGKKRTHPTQKPVQLYMWLMGMYCKDGERVIDTHLGSGTSAVAAYELGLDFTGIEISKEYFERAVERLRRHIAAYPKLDLA